MNIDPVRRNTAKNHEGYYSRQRVNQRPYMIYSGPTNVVLGVGPTLSQAMVSAAQYADKVGIELLSIHCHEITVTLLARYNQWVRRGRDPETEPVYCSDNGTMDLFKVQEE